MNKKTRLLIEKAIDNLDRVGEVEVGDVLIIWTPDEPRGPQEMVAILFLVEEYEDSLFSKGLANELSLQLIYWAEENDRKFVAVGIEFVVWDELVLNMTVGVEMNDPSAKLPFSYDQFIAKLVELLKISVDKVKQKLTD